MFEKISHFDPFARRPPLWRRGCIAQRRTPRRRGIFQRGSLGLQLVCMAPLLTAPCIGSMAPLAMAPWSVHFKWLGHPQAISFPTPTSSSSSPSTPSCVSLSSYSPSSQIPPNRRDFSVDFDLPPFLKVFSMATLVFVQLNS
jgi:hypothetical protein